MGGAAGDGFSFSWTLGLSQDGRYVSFDSEASNLVPGDTNRLYDTFVRDRLSNRTELVSVGLGGVPAEGNVFPSPDSFLSADGRFVAFNSLAYNLVPGDKSYPEGGRIDVFVRDRETQTTERVSVSSGGVAGNGHSFIETGGMAADGRFVAFLSYATNLVSGYGGGDYRLFVRDRKLGLTKPGCVASQDAPLAQLAGCQGCGVSADGRFVAFVWWDSDFNTHLSVSDRERHLTQGVDIAPGSFGFCPWSALSASGRYLMYSLYDPDDPTLTGLYVRDLRQGTDERVAFNAAGEEPNAYYNPTQISADGRYIVFDSAATNLVAGDANGLSDIFVLDRATKKARLVSVGPGGRQSNGWSEYAWISADGRVVAFRSDATNLLPRADGNQWTDIFVHFMGVNQ